MLAKAPVEKLTNSEFCKTGSLILRFSVRMLQHKKRSRTVLKELLTCNGKLSLSFSSFPSSCFLMNRINKRESVKRKTICSYNKCLHCTFTRQLVACVKVINTANVVCFLNYPHGYKSSQKPLHEHGHLTVHNRNYQVFSQKKFIYCDKNVHSCLIKWKINSGHGVRKQVTEVTSLSIGAL